MPTSEVEDVIELITGRWRSQILHAGVELGVFEAVSATQPLDAEEIGGRLKLDPANLYRLLRALSAVGLLEEDGDRCFLMTPKGAVLASNHPQSLRAMARLEEGVVHYAAWKHLPEVVRDGGRDGMQREFGSSVFERLKRDPAYAAVFGAAMSSYSAAEAEAIRAALAGELTGPTVFCDVGGGFGYLLAALLKDRPQASGSVLELPEVIADTGQRATNIDDVEARATHVAGDMFDHVPSADVHVMKHVLHDWNDAECVQILEVARKAAKPDGRLMIYEWVVPDDGGPHFAKLMDIHMMCVCTGRERTAEEYGSLLAASGWRMDCVAPVPNSPLSLVRATAA